MLKKISHGIVNKMNKVYPRSEEDTQKIEYYTEILLDQILILAVVFILCAIVGYHKEALISYTGFLALRSFAGGLHFKKRIWCLSVTGLIALLGGLVIYKFSIPITACLVLLLIDLILVVAFAPQVTKNNPITTKLKKIRKVESVVVIGIFIGILFISHGIWGKGLAIGASLATITILPIFMKLTE